MTSQPTDASRSGLPELPLDDIIAAADKVLSEDSDFIDPSRDAASASGAGAVRPTEPASAAGNGAPSPGNSPSPEGTGSDRRSDRPERAPGEGPELPPLRRKKQRVLRVFVCILLVLITLIGLLGIGADRWFHTQIVRGRSQTVADYDNVVISLPEENKEVTVSDDGKTVHYKGHVYRLNENVATVLFMGIDRESMDEVDTPGTAGQADVVLLIAVDTVTGTVNLINISRESYAEFRLYSADGNPGQLISRQLCVAYAYGNGRETSCDNMVEAVSKLLYDMPIEKYLALDMDGVIAANDAVGGVTLNSLSDLQLPNGYWVGKGNEITLFGKNLERYIRSRSQDMDANEERMARQRQYMQAFLSKLTQQARSDLGVISSLFNTLAPYMVTNLDLSDALFLAQVYLDHGLQMNMIHVAGTYDYLDYHGKINSVYYLDNDSLFEATLTAYYTQVD